MRWIEMLDGTPGPRRGDLLQTAYRTPKSRTWFVLRSVLVRRRAGNPRYKVTAARWWELEPEMRMRLARSAERRPGGQHVVFVDSLTKKKKRPTFDDYIRREVKV